MTEEEKDWRLFRKKLPEWQEKYMERLIRQYTELLSGDGLASDKFWELQKRIKQDKKRSGVVCEMSRSKMDENLIDLLLDGAITLEDLAGFSEDLITYMKRVMEIENRMR